MKQFAKTLAAISNFICMLVPLRQQPGVFVERKPAEQALRASEERYRLVVEDQTEAICRFTADGTFTYVNEVYCRLFGKTKTELLGNQWQPRAAKADLPEIEKQLRRLSPSNRVVTIENRVYNGLGELRWFQFVNRAFFDAAGVLTETQSVGRDITERKRAEAALRESEQRFKQVTESIQEVFWMINVANTGMVYVSPAYEKIWGRTCASLYASPQDWLEGVHPEDQERIERTSRNALIKGDYDEEFRIIRPDGGIRWIRARGFPVQDEHGHVYRVAGIAEDITSRKQEEKVLMESAARLRLITEQVPATIWTLDLDLKFTSSTGLALASLNLKNNEVVGRSLQEVFGNTEEVSPRIAAHRRALSGERMTYEAGWGGRIWRINLEPLSDSNGKIIGCIGAAFDITDAKQTEARLKELADIVESSRDAIIRLNRDRNIVIWNKGAEELFGYPAAEAVGKHISILMPPDRAEEATVIRNKIDQRELVEIPETMRRCKDGTLRDVSLKISPMIDPGGKLIGSAAIIRDITERKRLEKMLLEISANERRRIGHDLHDGLGQHLAGTAFKAKALEEVLAGESSPHAKGVGELVNLINDAISQTRGLAQGLDPVDLEMAGLPAALKKLAVQTTEQFRLTCDFSCNRERLDFQSPVGLAFFRIAQEAIHNAISHGKATHIAIALEAESDNLCMMIRDNGSGFQVQENLMTGMGLRIMRYRAHAIGGSFTIRSKTNSGTEIVCIAPQQTSLI